MSSLQDLLFQQLPGLTDGEPRHVGLSRRIRPCPERSHIRILGGDHMHHLKWDPKRLRRHLRERCIRALPDLRLPDLHLDAPVLIEHHPACGRFQRDRPYPGVIPEDCHPDAFPDISCLMSIFSQLSVIVKILSAFFHALSERIIIVYIL